MSLCSIITIVIASFLVSAVLSVDTSFACTDRANKHIAQNLDNPNWNSQDPYCGYHAQYADDRSQDEVVKYSWNVMNSGLFNAVGWNNKWCGMCLKVTKNGAPAPAPYVISKLVDYPTHYDMELQIDTYESLGLDMDADTDYVDVVPVVCPINGLLTHQYLHYEFGEANAYYFDVVVWDHIVPIDSAAVKGLDSSWTYSANDGWKPIGRSTWNEFETHNLPQLKPPWRLKITSIFGEEVIEDFVNKPNDYQRTFTESPNELQFVSIGCMQTVDPMPSVSPITTQPTVSPITKQPTVSPLPEPTTAPNTKQPTVSPITKQPTVSPITKQPTVSPLPEPTTAPNDCENQWDILPPINVTSSVNEDNRNGASWFCQFEPDNAVNTDVSLLWTGLNGVWNEFIESFTEDVFCGMCLKITKDDRTKIVKVATSGSSHNLELFPGTFEGMGGVTNDGLLRGMSAEPVACPIDGIQTRNTFHYQFGSSAGLWWFSVVIWDHIVPIKSVFVRRNDASEWLQTERNYNDFELSWGNDKMEGVLAMKIVSIFGEEVFDEIADYGRDTKRSFVAGTAQFMDTGCEYMSSTTFSTTTTTTTATTTTTTEACEEADDVKFRKRSVRSGEVCDVCFCDDQNVETCTELVSDLSDKKKTKFMKKCDFVGVCEFADVYFLEGADFTECDCDLFTCPVEEQSGKSRLDMSAMIAIGFVVILFQCV